MPFRDIDPELETIRLLREKIKVHEAEGRLEQLIHDLDDVELEHSTIRIEAEIKAFLPKRRRRLQALLDRRRKAAGEQPSQSRRRQLSPTFLSGFESDFRSALSELSSRHIFDWSNAYPDILGPFFSRAVEECADAANPAALEKILRYNLPCY